MHVLTPFASMHNLHPVSCNLVLRDEWCSGHLSFISHAGALLMYVCCRMLIYFSSSLWQPSSTISWCSQLPSSSAALSTSSLSSASLSNSTLSLESRASVAAATTAADDMESDEKPYVCDLCSCAYKHASSLLNHKLTHRTGDFK